MKDSIRTYVWTVFASQEQARTGILGIETAFGGQIQFLSNVEHTIIFTFNVSDAISRYQNILSKVKSAMNYVFGRGL